MNIPLCKPAFSKRMKEAAIHALQNERFVLGESVFRFEEQFAKYCGSKYAISVSSGTAALQFALLALGIKPGSEILTTPFSFIATANAILHAVGLPKFTDIDERTYTIDPVKLSASITSATKGIIPVHLYGTPCDMDNLLEIARRKNIPVVEDACQAHGAIYKGKKCGSIGDVGCFSFYPSKNMTVCGDGGMVITDDEKIVEQVRKLRDCGRKNQYEHSVIGYTARLNTVNAAIGIEQLKMLDRWNERRRSHARLYMKFLSGLDDIILPPAESTFSVPVYHLFVIRTSCREKLMKFLGQHGIATAIHYPLPIHLQPIYVELYGYKEGAFPISEKVSKEVLSLPMFPELKNSEIKYICEKIEECLGEA